jgi:hypothetical protein
MNLTSALVATVESHGPREHVPVIRWREGRYPCGEPQVDATLALRIAIAYAESIRDALRSDLAYYHMRRLR